MFDDKEETEEMTEGFTPYELYSDCWTEIAQEMDERSRVAYDYHGGLDYADDGIDIADCFKTTARARKI